MRGARYTNIRHTDRTMSGNARAWEDVPFTEKAFYLAEFRERTVALACDVGALAGRDGVPGDAAVVRSVIEELEGNRTRVVLLLADLGEAAALGARVVKPDAAGPVGAVWRSLRRTPCVAIGIPGGDAFAAGARHLAVNLGVTKLVVLDPAGGISRPDGSRVSFADLAELSGGLRDAREGAARVSLLVEIEAALREGLPAVNLCTAAGLADELFSYAGSGTLFTPERYIDVRRLGLDDLSAANDLIGRGVAEGYLAERSDAALDQIFANGFGAFVEGRHLAGIGALVPHVASQTSEIASLYTLTRFLGEGVGGHLVRGLLDAARRRGDRAVFACTTTERVVGFFEREGFARVGSDALPDEKWADYDPERRERVTCLRFELA
ncbi:MAG: GNAT family N-acetyltransferase [Myxococcota bacterium]